MQARAEADKKYLTNLEVREVDQTESEKIWNASRSHPVGKLYPHNVIGSVLLFPHWMFHGGKEKCPAYVGKVISKKTRKNRTKRTSSRATT